MAGYNNFVGWLNILNCPLPPVGMIVVLGFFCHKEEYEKMGCDSQTGQLVLSQASSSVRPVANLVPWGIASVNSMVIRRYATSLANWWERKKK